MRKYDTLPDLLTKETQNPAPKSAARRIETAIQTEHPTATDLVLFTAGSQWIVLPVGPDEQLRNTAQAARTRVSGKSPVAYCPRV